MRPFLSPLMSQFRHRLEFLPVWLVARTLGLLPRAAALRVGATVGATFYHCYPRLVRVGRRNLALALPALPPEQHQRILRRLYWHLGRQLAEFCMLPKHRPGNVDRFFEVRHLERFFAAQQQGKGVLILTGHLGAWELSSFMTSMAGHPLKFVIRPLDNPFVNELVNRYRGLYGNRPIGKQVAARGLLQAMSQGEWAGILLDQNSAPPQGVFVPFFGVQACTNAGMAKIALRTGAPVVPSFTVWEESLGKYVMYVDEPLPTLRSGDEQADVVANTAQYAAVTEKWIRRYPEQWLWVHRRWKTRPAGEPALY